MSAEEKCYRKPEALRLVKQLGLHKTELGISKGAMRQYRDSREASSYHAREYEDRICLHVDRFNPEKRPLEHFIDDVLNEKTAAGAAIGFTIGCIASRGDWRVGLLCMLFGGLIGNAAN